MNNKTTGKLLPFSLTLAVIALDQLTKWIITLKVRPFSIGYSAFGDFFQIIRVYNLGVAFSIGGSLSGNVRSFLFGLVPLIAIILVIIVYFRNNDLTRLHRWCIAGIVGGGLGNLLDRFFRPEGVLDFLDVKFYGIFGWERWPTFNVADSCVVICGAILMINLFMTAKDEQGVKK